MHPAVRRVSMPAMPRRETMPGMTRADAKAYVELAAAARAVTRRRGALQSWGDTLDQHPRFKAFGRKKVQTLRRMILAHDVFDARFDDLLVRYGSTKLEWIASLPDALDLVDGKKFQLADGTFTTLDDIKTGELQRELPGLRERRQKGGDAEVTVGGKMKMFDIPGDIAAIRNDITSRLKSLRNPLADGTMRFKVSLAKVVPHPLLASQVVEEAKQLYDVLLPFLSFIQILASAKNSPMVECTGDSLERNKDGVYEFEGRIVDLRLVQRLATAGLPTRKTSGRVPKKT